MDVCDSASRYQIRRPDVKSPPPEVAFAYIGQNYH
jgi:hypothetical protein